MAVKKTSSVWTTREGEQIRIADMGDGHLLNTIRYIERRVSQVQQTKSLQEVPLEAIAVRLFPHFADMLKEVKRRIDVKRGNGMFDEVKRLLAATPLVSPRKSRRERAKIRIPEVRGPRVTRKIILRD